MEKQKRFIKPAFDECPTCPVIEKITDNQLRTAFFSNPYDIQKAIVDIDCKPKESGVQADLSLDAMFVDTNFHQCNTQLLTTVNCPVKEKLLNLAKEKASA